MDGLTFVSNVIQSLAWPIAIVVLLVLLRGPLAQLVPLLRKLKYKELELDFAEKLEKAEAEADAAELPLAPTSTTAKAELAEDLDKRTLLFALARTSPRAAIAQAWRQLEHDIRDALERSGTAPPANMLRMMEIAQKHGILPQQYAGLVADLRGLRNQAIHGRDFDVDLARALEYIDLIDRVRSAIPNVQSESGNEKQSGP